MSKKITLENLKTFIEDADERYVLHRSGFGLSSNDFEDVYKNRIKSIEEGAEKNQIIGIQLNDVPLQPNKNRAVNIRLPEATEDELREALDLKVELSDDDSFATRKDIEDLFAEDEKGETK